MYGNCKDQGQDRSRDFVRQEFKRYKKKKPLPDFSNVVDFKNPDKFKDQIECITPNNSVTDEEACMVGLNRLSKWNIYKLKACPGIVFIPNPFQNEGQRYWAWKALTDYAKKPYPCNLDVHMKLDPNMTVWDISKMKCSDDPYSFMEKLRWSHLGYHFDYNVVTYKEEKYHGFPTDLSKLMAFIAKSIGYPSYVPETAIVNYYPLGSSMGGHTDHYEEELDQPLISISFGLPAVFLIGGKTRDIRPTAIWIRSGDILIMSGESRTAFHAVPCIIKTGEDGEPPKELQLKHGVSPSCTSCKDKFTENIDTFHNTCCTEQLDTTCCTEQLTIGQCNDCTKSNVDHFWKGFQACELQWKPFADYLSKTRININVRQVHCVT